jgi:hypothetical protein
MSESGLISAKFFHIILRATKTKFSKLQKVSSLKKFGNKLILIRSNEACNAVCERVVIRVGDFKEGFPL